MFGVEIEAIGLSYDDAAAAVSTVTKCRREEYGHQTRRHWKIVSDGSLEGERSFEAVSPVLSGEAGIAQVQDVVTALRKAGAKPNDSCGLHVHIGVSEKDVSRLKRLALRYVKYEHVLDSLMLPWRRGSSNDKLTSMIYSEGYAPPEYERFAQYGEAVRARMLQLASSDGGMLGLTTALQRSVGEGARYRKLNYAAYWRHGTVEFRHHHATMNATSTGNWIKLCHLMVDANEWPALGLPRLPLLGHAESFFRQIRADSALAEYYLARITRFADREKRSVTTRPRIPATQATLYPRDPFIWIAPGITF